MGDVCMVRDLRVCCADVPDAQGMDITVPRQPRKIPEFFGGHVQELLKPFCGYIGIKTFTQFRFLGGHPNRAVPAAAEAVLLAGTGHECGSADRYGISAQTKRFCKIRRDP